MKVDNSFYARAFQLVVKDRPISSSSSEEPTCDNGAWNANTNYSVGAIVSYDDKDWRALVASTGKAPGTVEVVSGGGGVDCSNVPDFVLNVTNSAGGSAIGTWCVVYNNHLWCNTKKDHLCNWNVYPPCAGNLSDEGACGGGSTTVTYWEVVNDPCQGKEGSSGGVEDCATKVCGSELLSKDTQCSYNGTNYTVYYNAGAWWIPSYDPGGYTTGNSCAASADEECAPACGTYSNECSALVCSYNGYNYTPVYGCSNGMTPATDPSYFTQGNACVGGGGGGGGGGGSGITCTPYNTSLYLNQPSVPGCNANDYCANPIPVCAGSSCHTGDNAYRCLTGHGADCNAADRGPTSSTYGAGQWAAAWELIGTCD